jgi:hypothetical protein
MVVRNGTYSIIRAIIRILKNNEIFFTFITTISSLSMKIALNIYISIKTQNKYEDVYLLGCVVWWKFANVPEEAAVSIFHHKNVSSRHFQSVGISEPDCTGLQSTKQ